jgi:hypothetical protein
MLRVLKSLIQRSSLRVASESPTVNGVSMNGCTSPAVVIRPRRWLLVVKYRMLSGPCTMSFRKHWQPSARNSVIWPAGVIVPIWLWKVPPSRDRGPA